MVRVRNMVVSFTLKGGKGWSRMTGERARTTRDGWRIDLSETNRTLRQLKLFQRYWITVVFSNAYTYGKLE